MSCSDLAQQSQGILLRPPPRRSGGLQLLHAVVVDFRFAVQQQLRHGHKAIALLQGMLDQRRQIVLDAVAVVVAEYDAAGRELAVNRGKDGFDAARLFPVDGVNT